MDANPWGSARNNSREAELCNKTIDDENFIIKDFAARGYKTFMVEDWQVDNKQNIEDANTTCRWASSRYVHKHAFAATLACCQFDWF